MSDSTDLDPVAGGVPVWREDGDVRIDVRGLEPPRPLTAIIELIERPGTGNRVVVIHHRDPALLYPEQTERGWGWEKLPAPEGEVRLLLVKDGGEGDK